MRQTKSEENIAEQSPCDEGISSNKSDEDGECWSQEDDEILNQVRIFTEPRSFTLLNSVLFEINFIGLSTVIMGFFLTEKLSSVRIMLDRVFPLVRSSVLKPGRIHRMVSTRSASC